MSINTLLGFNPYALLSKSLSDSSSPHESYKLFVLLIRLDFSLINCLKYDKLCEHCDTFEEMKQDILADGDGSSGVLQGFFGAGLGSGQGGHTLHWRNERGRIIVADGQCHEEMDFDEIVNRYGFNPGECIRTRLDTCEPDWERIGNDGVLGVDSTARRWVDTWNGGVYDKFGELVAKR